MAGALAMSGTMAMIPAIPAFAETSYGKGCITIQAGTGNADQNKNTGVTYHGYLIFHANVKDDGNDTSGKVESNISWANAAIQTAVTNVIKSDAGVDDNGKSMYTGTTAQDAAEYIRKKFGMNKTADTSQSIADGTGTRVLSSSFAYSLAKAVKESATTDVTDITENEKSDPLSEGYWLFVTDSDSTSNATDKTGTAPIFTVIGDSDVTVTEKTSIPTVDKKVKNDAKDASLGTAPADSQMGQNIEYKLTGTVADNIGTFEAYKYKFIDILPAAMTPDTENLKVYAVHLNEQNRETGRAELKKVTKDASNTENRDASGYTVTYDAGTNKLTIDFADLKSVQTKDGTEAPVIDANVKIIVDYQAKFDTSKADKVVYGGNGNENSVTLTYSNNPFSDGVGVSTPKKAKDYTYRLLLHKIDRTTEVSLAGAIFTIQATDPDEGVEKEKSAKYVQGDGSLGDSAHEFTTDDNGNIDVKGLDAGTYTVVEKTAPTGYRSLTDSFTFEIKPTYEGVGLKKLENVLRTNEPDSVIAGVTDGNTKDNVLKAKTEGNEAADAENGLVKITVGDTKKVNLPLTGQSGMATGVAAGGVLIVISAIALTKNRKKWRI